MSKGYNVLILFDMNKEDSEKLEKINPRANYIYSNREDVDEKILENADIIFGNLEAERVAKLKNLKWMQLASAGSDRFQEKNLFPENAILTNASGGYGPTIAEYMVGTLLMSYKNLELYRDNQSQGIWERVGNTQSIIGSKTLIIGLGNIGSEFGKRMKALGSYIIGVKRTVDEKPEFVDELYTNEKIDEIIGEVDIVALALPKTDETKDTLSKDRIEKLKENAVVINVGRGNAVNIEALTNALEEEKIWGACLDVTDPEPLPKDHKLWQMKNAIITPHISGGLYSDKVAYNLIIDICINNYRRFIEGKELENIVDFKRGY